MASEAATGTDYFSAEQRAAHAAEPTVTNGNGLQQADDHAGLYDTDHDEQPAQSHPPHEESGSEHGRSMEQHGDASGQGGDGMGDGGADGMEYDVQHQGGEGDQHVAGVADVGQPRGAIGADDGDPQVGSKERMTHALRGWPLATCMACAPVT